MLHVHPDRVYLNYVRVPDTDTVLIRAASPVLKALADDLEPQDISVILTSPDGLVVERVAADTKLVRALDKVQLAPGYSYAEEFTGTNGIGTALTIGAPTFIRGSEHYIGALSHLACAGSPIRDPITGRVLGAVDLTCWASRSDPLLLVLAKSASHQIEDRISALASESETALLEAYHRQSRRYPGGVLAIGGDIVLMNSYLRQMLDAADQTALLDHATELAGAATTATAVVTLPSATTMRISVAEYIPVRGHERNAVFHVQMQPVAKATAAQRRAIQSIPRLAGRSSAWRRSCQQVERCYRERDWVVIEGESGSGRSTLAQAVAQHITPERTIRVLRYSDFDNADDFMSEVEAETAIGDDFAVVIANLDELPDETLESLGAVLQTRAGHGWVAATISSGTRPTLVDMLVLPFFLHTVTMPALRHRIEDLEDLVPQLLRELTKGANVSLASEAMRQLAKLPWPGNVAQLRKVLAATLAVQRFGVIGVDKLPAECRSLARRKLTHLESLERDAIVRSLLDNNGSKADAAQSLGMSRATIYRKIKEFGIA
ncbi:sigma-54-dependent Fis family transcriptional regulator [Mycobacterium simiae]|uniref:sigma-54-dependent Fis family transcriptional regulator n=1 Tax=Mycobacterium simiae TaxID=1784 RepID=UPI000CAD2D86|nr:helix-turn-helix domain-containing protein [Mycobacterium simiae]PLV48634.1 siderophore-interacting protein [Mycobacterium tuberculosis variant microti OV254]BBX43492.1 siderophore-interacting protein [Mycobacterium simiae]